MVMVVACKRMVGVVTVVVEMVLYKVVGEVEGVLYKAVVMEVEVNEVREVGSV